MDAAWVPIGLAIISLVGSGVALLTQRGKMRMDLDNVALGQANDLIAALRDEVKDARLEIIALRQSVMSLTAQLEAARLEAANSSFARLKMESDHERKTLKDELELLRIELAKLKPGK